MVAAGHPQTAAVGAQVLREGGNAVDAVLASMLASWVLEPLLTGPGGGGYMLVAGAGTEPTLLDFFVAAPGADAGATHAELLPIEVDFGGARQIFNCGPASCGVSGTPAGIAAAAERWGVVPLADLAAPAAQLARDGIRINAQQGYIFEILAGLLLRGEPAAQELFAPGGRVLRAGDTFRSDDFADTIERLGRDGAEPFYRGDLADAVVEHVTRGGGLLGTTDLAAYGALPREPVRADYHGRQVLTNPPPSAGGILLALALGRLDALDRAPRPEELAAVMRDVQELRTPAFTAGLAETGFLQRFLAANLGSTTHISALDADGLACSATCSNGTSSGVVVPGTGIHLNNIMGEEDLNPLGFFRDPPGLRMPSMMSPTVVLGADGEVELVLGSAGSNRIRSAILQVVVNVVDHGMSAAEAIAAPRLHVEGGVAYAEPGIDVAAIAGAGSPAPFTEQNLFFGGVQAVERDAVSGLLSGAGDPRRGGAAVAA
ncbi:unannotated protein [freshwater metagenome]|uniref:Unannotated protein n=1 Tax=freshwater metagenome TaxID=449393 RepID=A0A6J7IWI6_9ZZZZ